MSSADSIRSLADSYPPADPQELLDLAEEYRRRGEREILDLAAIAADITADLFVNLDLEPKSNPALTEAFRLQYSGFDLDSLRSASESQLRGHVSLLKGKYFEVLARDRWNNGETLGGLTLGPGQKAIIAESLNQPGWDLKIINVEDGSTVELLQLKATESMSYVKAALSKYPDIRVVTTLEIDGASQMILSTDISDEKIENASERFIEEAAESPLLDALHRGTEFVIDAIPFAPIILVVTMEGRHFLTGQADLEESIRRTKIRLGTSFKVSAARALLGALIGGTLAAPSSVAITLALRRSENRDAMTAHLRTNIEELKLISS